MSVKIIRNMPEILAKIGMGSNFATIAVTKSVIEYGNEYVRQDQGALKDSALTHSVPEKGLAIWSTPYAKRVYYTGTPSKDINPLASLMWADKGVTVHKKELDIIAQKAFAKGMNKK